MCSFCPDSCHFWIELLTIRWAELCFSDDLECWVTERELKKAHTKMGSLDFINLFTDTKGAEDLAEQIVRGELAGDLA